MEESLLTEREGQVLRLMARGWDNVQIAAELGPAEGTVHNFVSRNYTVFPIPLLLFRHWRDIISTRGE
jgi:DNA-binding NarL/FixJ family response regulator